MNQTPAPASVGIVSIGDELLAGAHPDLNGPYLAARLAEWGREVCEIRSVGDDENDIAAAARGLLSRCALVLITGGLGPTEDDVTRHGAARALGVDLEFNAEAWGQVVAWYARTDREPPESNRRQALIPAGAAVLENPAGTAPGFRTQHNGSTLMVLPGPPKEVAAVFDAVVRPWLDANRISTEFRAVRRLYFADLSESVFADQTNRWMLRGANPLLGVTVKNGILSVRVLARATSLAAAEALADGRAEEVGACFPDHLFSRESADPAAELGRQLIERGCSITTAESCTAGRVVAALGSVPGISAVLEHAQVVYSNAAKSAQLGVDPALLEQHGAVSEPVVRAMAAGAAARSGARMALAVSGIAGPGGGSESKPVGTFWFAASLDGQVVALERRWPAAGRERLQAWAANKALTLGLALLRG